MWFFHIASGTNCIKAAEICNPLHREYLEKDDGKATPDMDPSNGKSG